MTPPGTLNDDIRLLGRTLGDVIADQAGTATLDLVEAIRRAAVGDSDPARLIDLLDPLPIAEALHVIRAFSYFAMLANIAEDTDHARRRRALVQSGTPAPAGTLAHAVHFERVLDAIAAERQLKGWRRQKKEAYIRGEFELLPQLSSRRVRMQAV